MDVLKPLQGVRVVDFCWVIAGPLGTRLLANFGAEVIRIESQVRMDALRRAPGPEGTQGLNLGGLQNDVNTGKLSVTIDLTRDEGRELVRKLVKTADVVTNNFRPGAMAKMGLGFEALQELKSDIILLNMPGCDQQGPWAQVGTMGNLIMGASGMNSVTGFPGRSMRGIGVAFPDFTAPYQLAICVLAALRERTRSGQGREIHLSQLSAMVSLMGVEWMQYKSIGMEPGPRANRDPNYCPHGVYETEKENEWLALAVAGDVQWRLFAEVLGRPGLASDLRFAAHADRKRNEEAVDAIVRHWARNQDRWKAAETLQRQGIAAAAVENLRDTLELDPQLQHHYERVTQPSDPDAEIAIDGEAIRFVGVERPLQRAPMLGEHNEYILRDIVGLSQEEFDQLVADGVIQ